MRNRVDKLGVTRARDPHAGRRPDRHPAPGREGPARRRREIIGTTAQLELYDLETSLVGPSISIRGFPVEHASLYELLARVQAQVEDGDVRRVLRRQPEDEARRLRAVRVRGGGAQEDGREAAAEPRALRRSRGHGRRHLRRRSGRERCRLPGRPGGGGVAPDRTYYYLFKYDPPNVPQMTGEDLKLSGTRADFDTSPGARRRADRDDGVHGRRARTSSRRSRATSGSAAA